MRSFDCIHRQKVNSVISGTGSSHRRNCKSTFPLFIQMQKIDEYMHVAIEELRNFTASSCVLSGREIFENLFLRNDESVYE